MSKLALLFFILCISFVHALFPRPWENQTWVSSNPAIYSYGVELWWDVRNLDKTIDGIDFGAELSTSDKKEIETALERKKKAQDKRDDCLRAPGLLSMWGTSTLFPTFSNMFIPAFSSISSCVHYKDDWIATVDSSLKVVERASLEAEQAYKESKDIYSEIAFLGLCNDNFSLRNDTFCSEAETAFSVVDAELTEGHYSQLPLFAKSSRLLNSELHSPAPDLSNISFMTELVWGQNGCVNTFDNLTRTGKVLQKNAEDQFNQLLSSAEGKKLILENQISFFESEKIHLVKKPPTVFEVRTPGSPSDLLKSLKQKKMNAVLSTEKMKLERESFSKKNHLANSIDGMSKISNQYDVLISEASDLAALANAVIIQQKTEAESEIKKAEKIQNPSTETSNLLIEAKEFYILAENRATLGDSFSYYSKAAASARKATDQRNFESELLLQSSFAQLEKLVKNAKKDGINVITEEETLSMLKNLKQYQIDVYVDRSISSIISKAKLAFEGNLLETRSRLHEKLNFAGPQAADLYTDLNNFESGIMLDGKLQYPQCIGELGRLTEDYSYLEDELDYYISDIVGNSMSIRGTPLIMGVSLDVPAEITLDLLFSNPRPYGASNVKTSVQLSSPLPVLYSDITFGSDSIDSVHRDGDNLVMVFRTVSPFETKRVTFSKQAVLAHTISKTFTCEGLGNGAAHLYEALEFELDTEIPHLELDQGLDYYLIDGANPERSLSPGRHQLTRDIIIPEAYLESTRDFQVSQIGPKSKVEYTIEILPYIDIDTLPIFINALNDSKISKPNVFVLTGGKLERVKPISGSQYAATLSSIKKGSTIIIKISYSVEDAESFVKEQLALFENINTTTENEKILKQAQEHSAAGNHTLALQSLEKFKSLVKDEEKTRAKLQKKYEELIKPVKDEVDEIISVSTAISVNSTFIDKLDARQDELERVLEEIEDSNLTESIDILGKVNKKWLTTEIKTLKKDSYKEYNDLKEQFLLSGNTSTPKVFLEFETDLNRLEVGSRLEYAISVIQSLESVRSIVRTQQQYQSSKKENNHFVFESLKSEVEDVLDVYLKQASAAKGTDYSSYFTVTERSIESLIKEAEGSLVGDERFLRTKLGNLNKSKNRMESTLSLIKNESKSKLTLLEQQLSRLTLDEETKKQIAENLQTMRKLHETGDYVNALRAGSSITKKLDQHEPSDEDGLLILGITAIAFLAAAGAYMLKQKPKKGPKKLPKITDLIP